MLGAEKNKVSTATVKDLNEEEESVHKGYVGTDDVGLEESEMVEYGPDEILDETAENAPLPEVRSVVSPFDDDSLPVNTFRAWLLGILFTIIGSGINQFFSMRYPGITISSMVAQLVSFPCGVFLAKVLPVREFSLGRLGKYKLNPDRKFNSKEHTLITIMANISFTSAWATDIIQAQFIYGKMPAVGFQFLLVLTCQLFGLGIAGLAQDILVHDSRNYWPTTLANVALFASLHSKANPVANGWMISRLKFFLVAFGAAFIYYFFPGFIFTALSNFTWICWIVPKNIVVNQLFGQIQGLGFSPITFDWSQITYGYSSSPMLIPPSALVNGILSWLLFFAILPVILYYTNKMYFSYLPMSSSTVFDNKGNEYNGSRVLDGGNLSLNEEAYRNYSPPFLAATYAISYACSYAVLSSSITYLVLYHGKSILETFKGQQKKDVHVRQMEKYKAVPKWWYILLTLIIYAITIGINERYETDWPVWGITIALLMVAVFIIPVGIVYARTNINTNCMTVLGQVIAGYALNPPKPIVSLLWKFYAYTGISQAMYFSQDIKLGYYMKVPKRTIFAAQFTACIIGAIVQVGVLLGMLQGLDGICTPGQKDNFTCPQGTTNYAASVIWGLVGPQRLISAGKLYSGFLHLFWIGAVVVLLTWLLQRKFPNNRVLKNINWVVFFGALGNYPPATGINYTSAFVVGIAFNYFIKRRYGNWWLKYNFVLSSALDVGTALSGIVIFLCLGLTGASLKWWGNEVYNNTADGKLTPYKELPSKGYFGPSSWS